ncbi:hypothetical protein [Ornithinimicrobium cryptoxanthini]|uniref:hypothetical protein n=1 Tax=Ornithinimicrobium cryptoxanthini TaxID=2934161 RepID=UPI0021178249|nr:hypothetical protein [Ornithinimicrobium cryptoxanthini]
MPDAGDEAVDIGWNVEKWVIDGTGTPVARFRSRTQPAALSIEAELTEHAPHR